MGLVDQSLDTAHILGARAVGTNCECRVYEGQPHGFFNHREEGDNRYYKETLAETERFFEALGCIR